MSWINDESRWEPGEPWLRAGPTLYWLATIIAAVIVVFALADFIMSWAQGAPILRVFAFAAAVLVWLLGRICRLFLSP